MTTTVYHLDWKAAADLRDLTDERDLLPDERSIDLAFSRAMTGTVSPAILDLFMNGHYHKVATVATDDLGNAYRLTNSIKEGWWNNHGVVTHFEAEGARSTSMGDLLRDEDGVWYIVASIGFTKLIGNQGEKS